MNNLEKVLAVIIPTTRGVNAIPTIHSAILQTGFKKIYIVITGKNTGDNHFVDRCKQEISGNLFFVKSADKDKILPGEARNDGLNFVDKELLDTEYILFLDDDIIIPNNYGEKLRDFLEEQNLCAVMGRVVSYPNTFWSTIIDYSNFWWLQIRESNPNLGWLGTGATLSKFVYLKKSYFDNNVAVNEDVVFFNNIVVKTNKHLGICADVTCEHRHNRSNPFEFAKYQFNNGEKGVLFHYSEGINVGRGIKNILSNFKAATRNNQDFLKKHFTIKVGVLISFIIFEIGIQYGSYLKKRVESNAKS